MALIRKEIEVEAKIGDIVLAPKTVYRSDLILYICYIKDDLLYISHEKDASIEECEKSFSEDCYLA